jgi:hypothetical protein
MRIRFDRSRTRLAMAVALVFAGTQALAAESPHFPAPSAATEPASASAATPHYALRMAQRAARKAERLPGDGRHRSTPHPRGGVLPVTSCADDGSDGTLRQVIAGAAEGDVVDLSALACGTITLTQGIIDLSVLGTHHINDLSLTGPGADVLTIDGNGDRVFAHGDYQLGLGTLSISDVTIANGNYTHGLASCIDSSGVVALTRAVVTGCEASGGGPLTFGGAVSAGYLEMSYSTISNSHSSAAGDNVAIGGGAYVSSDATLVESTISGNTVVAETPGDGTFYLSAGGGLYVRGALTMQRSAVAHNAVYVPSFNYGWGGGIFVRADTEIEASTFDNNFATLGGGLYKAVFSHYGDPGTTLTIGNSTFWYNFASMGAGVASARPATIASSTLTNNLASFGAGGAWIKADADLTLQSSIVARNRTGDYLGLYCDLLASGGVVGSNNLVIVAGETTALPVDTITADPMLAPLADNGGPTPTVLFYQGSPALDAGANPAAFAYDQRGAGFDRAVGAAPDIGAIELQNGGSEFLFRNEFETPNGSVDFCPFTDAEDS